jgi:hypothetical protein
MPFITDLKQTLIHGGAIRCAHWPAKCHIRLFDIKDNRLRSIGQVLVLFTPTKTTDFKTKNYTPAWPEIIGDDWEVFNQQ